MLTSWSLPLFLNIWFRWFSIFALTFFYHQRIYFDCSLDVNTVISVRFNKVTVSLKSNDDFFYPYSMKENFLIPHEKKIFVTVRHEFTERFFSGLDFQMAWPTLFKQKTVKVSAFLSLTTFDVRSKLIYFLWTQSRQDNGRIIFRRNIWVKYQRSF